jgi:hypothetical protein
VVWRLIAIGTGPGVAPGELKAIAEEATSGQAFTSPDSAKIADVLYAGLSTMLCQPPVCQPSPG